MLLQLETLKAASLLIHNEIPLLYKQSNNVTKSTFKHLDIDIGAIMNDLLKSNEPESKE